MRAPFKMLTLVVGGAAMFGSGACAPLEDFTNHQTETGGQVSVNGLTSFNGLHAKNGLDSLDGMSSVSGLNSANGLSTTTGLLTTSEGRNLVSYLVRCALPAGRTITKVVAGSSYSFPGQIGVAPAWENNACDTSCQEEVSACILAHVNTSGQHISLWIDGDSPALGWGRSSAYPYQEGSFFGNIFVTPAQAYFCNGEDFDLGTVPGRLGVGQNDAPYSDPFGATAPCRKYCTAANSAGDGYSLCNGFKHVVTVYRDWDPSTDYKICSRSAGTCLSVSGSSTSDGAPVVLASYANASNQKFRITRVSDGIYKICGTETGKCLSPNGTALEQRAYAGSIQQWKVSPHVGAYGYYFNCSVDNGTCAATRGSGVVQDTFHNIAAQEWSIALAN